MLSLLHKEVQPPAGSMMTIEGNLLTSQIPINNINTIDLKTLTGSKLTGKSPLRSSTDAINLERTSSTWNMTDSSTTTKLVIQNTPVNFTHNDYTTLTDNTLSGNGIFNMKINIDQQQDDFFRITQSTTGYHQLAINNQASITKARQKPYSLYILRF